MKQLFKVGAGAALVLCIPLLAFAAEFRTGEQVNIGTAQTVNDDLYAAGNTVTSSGNVMGDLYAAGGTVSISGHVGQDIGAAGGTVTVTAEVGDDVRAAGGTVIVQGKVASDAILAGGQINLSGPGVEGDVAIGGGVININAPIGGDVRLGGGKVYINAPINGTVKIDAEQVTLGSGAVLHGDLIYTSPKKVVLEEGAQTLGKVTYTARAERGSSAGAVATFFTFGLILKFLMLLVGAMVIGLGFRRYSGALALEAGSRPLLELGRGFLFFIGAPLSAIILFVTVLGLPLGFLALLCFFLAIVLGILVAPVVLGSYLYRLFTRRPEYVIDWKTILLGVVVYFVIGLIPFVGWLFKAIVVLITIGALVRQEWLIIKEWR